MKITHTPALHVAQYSKSSFPCICEQLLPDGIQQVNLLLTRINAQIVNLISKREPQQFKTAVIDVIEEMSKVTHSGSTLCVVVYGTKRTYLAAKLIVAGQPEHPIKLVISAREADRNFLDIPRINLYQIDTDRYPFTDVL